MTSAKLPWIKLKSARKLLGKRYPAHVDGAALLAEAIASGTVSVRGQKQQIRRPDRGIYEDSLDDIASSRKPKFKLNRGKSLDFLSGLNPKWVSAGEKTYLMVESENDRESVTVLTKIKLRERDLHSYLSKRLTWSVLETEGRPRATAKWLQVTGALLLLERNGRLNMQTFGTEKELSDKVLELVNSILDERTIRPEIERVFDAFVKNASPKSWAEAGGDEDAEAALFARIFPLPRNRSRN